MAGITKLKRLISGFFLGTLLLGLMSNALAGGGPHFNSLQGDTEFFTGRNSSKGETTWVDPVNADAGETVDALLYYHNDEADTTAVNTTFKVTLPRGTATQHVLQASLSADNAPTITDTIVNGQVVGKSGLTINASTPASLGFIPGSVQWFPDNSTTPVTLPNGQTGAELFTTSGLNIGETIGCWAHAGYVLFKLKLSAPPVTPELTLTKDVHTGSGHTPFGDMWTEKVTIKPGDEAHFRLTITNPGTGKLDNVRLVDQLPVGLSMVANSAVLYKDADPAGTAINGDLTQGVDLGLLNQTGGTVPTKLTVIFTAKATGTFVCGDTTLTNTATATSGSLTSTDTAQVVVNVTGPQCQGTPNIEKSKKAYNETQKVDATTVTAKPGDVITYTLVTKNSGTAASNDFVIEDGIRDILDYADITAISDNGQKVDQPSVANRDDQTLVRYPAVTINAGQSTERTFTVKVKNPIPDNARVGTAFDFVMFNKYGNNVVIVVTNPTFNATITKLVRNTTKNETVFVTSNTATPGDTLEYQVVVKNTSNTTLVGARLKDVLPNGVTYVANSVSAKLGNDTVTPTGDLFGDGLALPSMAQNAELTLTFKVATLSNLANNTNLVNTAKVQFAGQEKEAKASTVVLVATPPPTPTTPSVTPSPVQATTLPKAGANPFGIMFMLAGSLYTALARRHVKQQYTRLSDYIEII